MSFIIFPGVITPPLTPGAVPYGTGSNVLMNAQGTSGQVLISGGANAPTWANAAPSTQELAGGVAGDLPYQQAPSDTTFLNLVSGGILYGGASAPAYLANVQGGVLYGGATDPAYLAAGTAGQVLQSNGTSAPTWTTDIGGNAANVTGTVAVANGGTGLATLTAENVLLGDGTNNVKFVAPGSNGNVLTSNGTTWQSSALPSFATSLTRTTKTANYTLIASDQGNLIECTSNTFTLSFTAAATLGSGWFCYLYNSGTGDITLDPNSSETIDGLTSYVMNPAEARLVTCDGSQFFTIILNPFIKTILSTQTFNAPPGYKAFQGLLWGAGGSGGIHTINRAGGGGGGACAPFFINATSFGASQTITIGAGGASRASGTQQDGQVGGTSSIGSIALAYGGGGGGRSGPGGNGGGGGGILSAGATGSNSVNAGGDPVTYVSGTTSTYGNSGFGGGTAGDGLATFGFSTYGGGAGGSTNVGAKSVYGGGGGGGTDNSGTLRAGGTSVYGGAGGNGGGGTQVGKDGTVPGGGGGGGFTGTGVNSGAGADGQCLIIGVI